MIKRFSCLALSLFCGMNLLVACSSDDVEDVTPEEPTDTDTSVIFEDDFEQESSIPDPE